MNARKHKQKQLANDWALGEGCVAVNDGVWFEDRDGVRVVCVGNTPFYTYDLKDRVQHLFCACQLIEARLAKQCAVIRAFGISERTLQRARRKVRKEGIGGLVPQKKGPRRRYRGGGAVGRRIVKLWNKGVGRLEIAARLGPELLTYCQQSLQNKAFPAQRVHCKGVRIVGGYFHRPKGGRAVKSRRFRTPMCAQRLQEPSLQAHLQHREIVSRGKQSTYDL